MTRSYANEVSFQLKGEHLSACPEVACRPFEVAQTRHGPQVGHLPWFRALKRNSAFPNSNCALSRKWRVFRLVRSPPPTFLTVPHRPPPFPSTGGRYKSWKRRWFIICNNCLFYFENMVRTSACCSRTVRFFLRTKLRERSSSSVGIRQRCRDRFYNREKAWVNITQKWVVVIIIIAFWFTLQE